MLRQNNEKENGFLMAVWQTQTHTHTQTKKNNQSELRFRQQGVGVGVGVGDRLRETVAIDRREGDVFCLSVWCQLPIKKENWPTSYFHAREIEANSRERRRTGVCGRHRTRHRLFISDNVSASKKNEPASAHTSTHRKENAKTKFAETAKKDAERDEPPDSAPMRPPPRRCRKFGKKNRTQSLTRPLFLCYSNAFRFDFKRSDFNRCLNRQKEERGGTTSFSLIRDAPIGRSWRHSIKGVNQRSLNGSGRAKCLQTVWNQGGLTKINICNSPPPQKKKELGLKRGDNGGRFDAFDLRANSAELGGCGRDRNFFFGQEKGKENGQRSKVVDRRRSLRLAGVVAGRRQEKVRS